MRYIAIVQAGFDAEKAKKTLEDQNLKIYSTDPSGQKFTIEIPSDEAALSLSMLEEFASFIPAE